MHDWLTTPPNWRGVQRLQLSLFWAPGPLFMVQSPDWTRKNALSRSCCAGVFESRGVVLPLGVWGQLAGLRGTAGLDAPVLASRSGKPLERCCKPAQAIRNLHTETTTALTARWHSPEKRRIPLRRRLRPWAVPLRDTLSFRFLPRMFQA